MGNEVMTLRDMPLFRSFCGVEVPVKTMLGMGGGS